MPRLKLIEMDSLNKMIYFRKDDKLIAFGADVAIELISDSLDGKYAPVRHGHWKKSYISAWYSSDDTEHLYLYCSACGTGLELQGNPARKIAENDSVFKYCPNCGAKMDEVEDNEIHGR